MPSPARRFTGRVLRVGLLVGLLALALAAAFARAHAEEWLRGALAGVLEREGLELRSGRIELHAARLAVELVDVRIARRPGEPGRLEAEIPYARVELSWRALLGLGRGRVYLRRVLIERPRVATDEALLAGRARPEPRAPLEFDVRADQFRLTAGSWLHEGTTTPLELALEDVDARGAWSGDRRAMLGSLQARLAVLARPLVEPLRVEARAQLRWRGRRVEWFDLEATSDVGHAELSGTLDLDRVPRIVTEGRVELDLDVLQPKLEARAADLGGRVAGDVRLSLGQAPLGIEGLARATHVSVGRVRAERATARFVLAGDELVLQELDAAAHGGTVRGTVRVGLAAGTRLDLDLEARDLAAESLLDWIGLDLPVDARVDSALRFAGAADVRSTWAGAGTFELRPTDSGARRLPTAATGELKLAGGRLGVSAPSVSTAGARYRLEIDADLTRDPTRGEVTVSGSTADAHLTQLGVLRILESLGAPADGVLARRLEGTGSFAARIGLGGSRDLDLTLDLAGGRWEPESFDRAVLDLALRGADLTIRRIEVDAEARRLRGALRLRSEPLRLDEIDLEASGIEVANLLVLAEIESDLVGSLEGELHARRDADGLSGGGRIRLSAGRWLDEPFDEASATVEIAGDRVKLRDAAVRSAALEARGEALVRLAEGRSEIRIDSARVDLALLDVVRRSELPVEGACELRGELRAEGLGVAGELAVAASSLAVHGIELGDAAGTLRLEPGRIEAELDATDAAGWKASAAVELDADFPLRARVDVAGAEFDLTRGRGIPAWLRLGGRFEAAGPVAAPERIGVDGILEMGELHVGTRVVRLREPVDLRLADRRLELGALRLEEGGSRLEVGLRYDLAADELAAEASGRIDLATLSLLVPELRAQGGVDVDLRASGPLGAPRLDGSARVDGARLRYLGFPLALEQLAARLEFAGRAIEVTSVRAVVGGGEIAGSGRVVLGGQGVEQLALTATVGGVRLELPEGFTGVYEGHLELGGDARQLELGGELELVHGLWSKEFEVGALLAAGSREYSAEETGEIASRIRLDLELAADDNVWVRNELAELETGLDLHFGGTVERPEMTGRVWVLDGGRLRFQEVRYQVRSCAVEFVDPSRIDPYVTLDAEASIGGYDVTLRVAGTAERLEYELSSNPALATQDIIALLASGRAPEDTADPGRVEPQFTGDLAANYFAGALTEPVEEQIAGLLGLDRVRIDPLILSTSDPTARITVGKEIRDNVAVIVAYRADRAEEDLYQVEWRPSTRMIVTAERATNGGVGGSVFYTHRYWWKRPQGAPAEAEPGRKDAATGGAAAVVGSVGIEGVGGEEAAALLARTTLEPGDVFRRSRLYDGVQRMRELLVEQGRIEARLRADAAPQPDGSVDVVYTVEPGPAYRIEFAGVSGREERELRRALGELWIDALFREDLYADSVEAIRERFQRRGFYAVDVYHESIPGDPPRLRFVVDRGKEVRTATVTIEGAAEVDEQRIRRQMLTRPPSLLRERAFDPQVLQQDVAAIRNLYRDLGYLAVVVEPPELRLSAAGDSVDVRLVIREGPRATVADVEFPAGLEFTPAELSGFSGLEVGAVFSRARLLEAESALRRALDERGRPAAQVRAAVRLDDDGATHVRFDVDPGPEMRVAEIRVRGNLVTREAAVRRELAFAVGEPLSRQDILRSQHALYRLGAFRSVRVDHWARDEADPTERVVEVRLTESQPLRVAVGVGYNTESKLNLSLASSHDNLGGTLRSLGGQLVWNQDLRRAQLLAKSPRLLGAEVPTLGSLLWERDSQTEGFTVERRSAALRVERKLVGRVRGFGRYAFQIVDIFEIEDPQAVEQERLNDGRFGSLEAGILHDTRDDAVLPTRGNQLLLGGAVFAKGLLSDFELVKGTLTESHTWSFPNRVSFASSLRAAIAKPFGDTTDVPISERYFAGGSSTVRGFEIDMLGPVVDGFPQGGEAMLILNEELRFPLRGPVRGTVFYDLGNVYRTLDDFDVSDLRHVLGLGIRLETPIGPLRAEYGWKLDREPGESGGQFYFSIGNAF